MNEDQKIVAVGAAGGVIGMALIVWLLSGIVPAPAIPDTPADRLAYALPWAVVAVLPLFFMVVAVGNARFKSEAIDPTRGKDSPTMIVNGRVVDNTLQQFTFFLVGLLALAVTLPHDWLGIVPSVAITFVLMRIAFWVGYRIKPIYRAFGFSSTAYMNLGMLIAALWLWLS